MRSFLIKFSLVIFAISACKNEGANLQGGANSPESYAQSLVSALKNKDEAQIWEHFIHKDELKEMLSLTNTNTAQIDKQVEDMWSAMEQDKGNQYRIFESSGIDDWSTVSIDSVRLALRKNSQLGEDVVANPDSKAEGMGALHIYLKQGDNNSHVLIPCVKMKSGLIRMVAYPRFD